MTKAELLQEITRRFERAIDGKYEYFSVSIACHEGKTVLSAGGAYGGFQGQYCAMPIELEEKKEEQEQNGNRRAQTT